MTFVLTLFNKFTIFHLQIHNIKRIVILTPMMCGDDELSCDCNVTFRNYKFEIDEVQGNAHQYGEGQGLLTIYTANTPGCSLL